MALPRPPKAIAQSAPGGGDRFKVVNDFLADFLRAMSVVIILISLYKI
ncbi:hypothetical protein NIES4073_32550 [Kalymmatonema gypsitolerans NIES-4073]|nr:hypothetical protein NIES4073_32550 [Scytonema sp. NIES-4073]